MQISTRHRTAIKNIVRREIDAARLKMFRHTAGEGKTTLHLNHADNFLNEAVWRIQQECMDALKG